MREIEIKESVLGPWSDNLGIASLYDVLVYAANTFCLLMDSIGAISTIPDQLVGPVLKHINGLNAITIRLPVAREMCIRHGWDETASQIKQVENYIKASDMDVRILRSKCQDLMHHIQRLLSEEIFFHADQRRSTEFLEWIKGCWPKISDRFPNASAELSSAGECYMYGKGTASVFHAMRALDIGLSAFALSLGTSMGRDQWEVVINNIESKIKAINGPHAGPDWKEKQENHSEAALHFRYLKNAWRNHVMHARSQYELEDAAKIWHHVSDFVLHLAERLRLKET